MKGQAKDSKKQIKELLEGLLNVHGQELKFKLEKKYNNKNLSDCDNVIFLLISKSTKTTRAILHLTDLGYIEDGFALLRGLLESLVNAKFILRDKQIYPIMFLDYGFYDWYRKFENLLKDSTSSDFAKQCKQVLGKADHLKYEQIKQCRGRIKGNDCGWSKKTLKEMAELCSLKNPYYDKVYFYLSQYTHSHISGLNNYPSKLGNTVVFDDSPNLKRIDELLITTTDLYFQLLELLIDFTKIKHNKTKLERTKDKFKTLIRAINNNDAENKI